LTEKVAYERRVREQKLRLETMQAKRESAAYLEMVEKGKTFAGMEGRKRAKAAAASTDSSSAGSSSSGAGSSSSSSIADSAVRRRFRQAQPVKDVGGGAMDKEVLRAVFATDKRSA
jgi:ESF2/ABP1 family protein